MKVFFVVLILCHLFVTKSMASSAYGWFKNKGTEGDDTLVLGVNNTGPNHQYSKREIIDDPSQHTCYTEFFVGQKPPKGFRPFPSGYIKYICQKMGDLSRNALYVTMFDQRIGIAVYSAYRVKYDEVPLIGTFPRISKWFEDPGIGLQGTNKMYEGKGKLIHKGHLVPAATYSFDCIAMVSTFTYTNAVPQHAAFNIGPWSQYEKKVRKFASDVCRSNNGDLYLMTGTSEAVMSLPNLAVKRKLKYFPGVNDDTRTNIVIPNSMWTAGCCINRNGQAVGGFALIGNNDKDHPLLEQKKVEELQDILAIGIGVGAKIELFPGNIGCSQTLNQYRYEEGATPGWTKSLKLD